MQADQPVLLANNRAFKYGDGLFETIRIFNGQIPFIDYHFNRLKKGLLKLKYKIPNHYSSSFFEKEIQKLVNNKGNHRIRLTVFRSAGGFYTPADNHPQFLIESTVLKDASFQLNPKGLNLGLFDEIKIPQYQLANLKTCNSLPYILAGIYNLENGFDDCLIINNSGNIAECTSSNIFVVKKETLWTPSLSEACIAGTMRKIILEIAQANNIKTEETMLKISDLKQAEEVWLTNAIQGIKWIDNFKDLRFKNKLAARFVQLLNEKIKQKTV